MTMIEVVNELTRRGHSVQFSKRKDGGILIRYIDGVHYTGAKGNAMARQLAGVNISEARQAQLKYATQVRTHPIKKVELTDIIEQEYKRVKKLWNKAFKSKKGKPHPAGYFGKKRIKKSLRDYGEQETLRRIHEAERYASGIAYSKNVESLAGYVLDVANKLGSKELETLSQDILNNAYAIREEWIYPAYQKLYDLNKGIDPKQIAKETRRILRL